MKIPEPQTDFGENFPETPLQPPERPRRWLWLLIASLLLIGGSGAIAWRLLAPGNPTTQSPAAQPPGVAVKLATVQAGIIEESSDFIAPLESRRSVTLQPRIQGQVTQIFVRSGVNVPPGAAIMQVDPREQQAAVSGVSATVAAARAQLESARATLSSLEAERLSNVADVQLNQQEYSRYSNLASQGAVSRQTSDRYANQLAAAQSRLNAIDSKIQAQRAAVSQAEKAIQQAQANTREQQVQLQYYRIIAPIPGTIGDIPVKVGDFVNTSTQLVTITQNRPLEVKISVPMERGPQLRQGMPVQIADAQGKLLGISRVFFIAPTVTNNTQSILIKALFNNAKNELRADQFVRARVIWNQRSGVLVPTTAISRVAGETFVYVAETAPPTQTGAQTGAEGGAQLVAKQKRVKLGNIRGNNYQVIEGLQPGEKIVVSGLLNLRDGDRLLPE
jgi:RND family efflux transporter MFP subunit